MKDKKRKKDKQEKDEWIEVALPQKTQPIEDRPDKRHDWMDAGSDLFATKEREKTRRELELEQKQLESETIIKDRTITHIEKKSAYEFGDSGSNWRMMKLKQVFERAKEEGKSVEEMALIRFGCIDDFNILLKEREYLDRHYHGNVKTITKRSTSSLSSRGFINPLKSSNIEAPKVLPKPTFKLPELVSNNALPTTITKSIDGAAVLSKDELNKMRASLVKARIMNSPDLKTLEGTYKTELERHEKSLVDVIIVKESEEKKTSDSKDTKSMKAKVIIIIFIVSEEKHMTALAIESSTWMMRNKLLKTW